MGRCAVVARVECHAVAVAEAFFQVDADHGRSLPNVLADFLSSGTGVIFGTPNCARPGSGSDFASRNGSHPARQTFDVVATQRLYRQHVYAAS